MICPSCGYSAFVIDGKMTCCRLAVTVNGADAIRFELDMVGAHRKLPPKAERDRILIEQGHACFYCGLSFENTVVIRRGKVESNFIHWDHIIPFVFNGNNEGFVAACSLCNHRKSDIIFNTLNDAKTYLKLKHNEDKAR